MSYIRIGSERKFVEGESKDYVYSDYRGFIEDYGDITNEGLIELIGRYLQTEDKELKEYIIKKLAEKLNVKLKKGWELKV